MEEVSHRHTPALPCLLANSRSASAIPTKDAALGLKCHHCLAWGPKLSLLWDKERLKHLANSTTLWLPVGPLFLIPKSGSVPLVIFLVSQLLAIHLLGLNLAFTSSGNQNPALECPRVTLK